MFVDASAAASIILDEPDRETLRLKLKATPRRFMSAIADYETVMAVRRDRNLSVTDAHRILEAFKAIYAIRQADIGQRHAKEALDAFGRFGKGQGHKAQLNMGDCFSYACAKALNVPLLCKGDDFLHTDIKIA